MIARFTVVGEPTAKGRPRFTKGGRAYTPEKTILYENLVRTEYERQCDVKFSEHASLAVKVQAYYGIPQSASKRVKEAMESGKIKPLKRPDVDNICKSILDSLNGYAYQDDKQVYKLTIEKRYSNQPRVEVTIWEVPSEK